MIDPNNSYTKMQHKFYEASADKMALKDHVHHNDNGDYWKYLIWPGKSLKGKMALDLGCGTGRSVKNLLDTGSWKRVDGVDISKKNIDHACIKILDAGYAPNKFNLYVNNGVDLSELKDNTYHFVMSTITLQHIAVHEIRYNLLKEVYRVLKPGGTIAIQMGYGKGYGKADYFENAYSAKETNTKHDVTVESVDQIKYDLDRIGFVDFDYAIRPSFSDGHPNWIFFKATK